MCLTPWHPPRSEPLAIEQPTGEESSHEPPVLVGVTASETSPQEIRETFIRPQGLFRIQL